LTLKDATICFREAEAKKAKLKIENSEYQIQRDSLKSLPQITANGNLTHNPIIQTTVIDGAGFGQPGTTIQAAFGQNGSQQLVSINTSLV
jgi:outer membrane protein TolC